MKTLRKPLAWLLAMLMLVSVLAACQTGPADGETTEDTTAVDTPAETDPGSTDTKLDFTITVKSTGGLPLSGVNVYVYADNTLEDLVNYGTTDAAGQAKISMKSAQGYVAVLTGLPEGYNTEAFYPLTGLATEISVTSAVVENTDHSGKSYQLGDVMRDFSVVDSDGNTQKLSELLKTKKMVLINFWYTTCSWCVKEFPYMDAVYQQYKDDIEIVALNHSTLQGDSEEGIKKFKENFYTDYVGDGTEGGLSFPMAKDYTNMGPAFNLQGYPTSVIVDRYGVITLIESGAITSLNPFTSLFETMTADDYQQKLYNSVGELIVNPKPTYEMDTPENVAVQLWGTMFAVPQISNNYDKTTPEQRDVLKNYLRFWTEHKKTLMDGKFNVQMEEHGYGYATARGENEKICLAISSPYLDATENFESTYLVNITNGETVILKAHKGDCLEMFDCRGKRIASNRNRCRYARNGKRRIQKLSKGA